MTENAHINFREYPTSEALALDLACQIMRTLGNAINEKGTARLAVSGGSTPKLLFKYLSTNEGDFEEIDWSKVTITLVDERWVDENSDRSNARLVKTHLLLNAVAQAHFIPLFDKGLTIDQFIETQNKALIDKQENFDCIILGMGTDGHTASFFPGGNHLEQALDLNTNDNLISMEAEGAGEIRITYTRKALLNAKYIALHFEGQEKREIYEKALQKGPMTSYPVRAFLQQKQKPIYIYWTSTA